MEKMTITERINGINFETLTQDEFDFLVERALKSVRKSSGVRKPSKAQVANEGLKADLLDILGDGMTATEAGKALDISVQKASALLNQLVKAEQAVKVKEGKTLLFRAAE